MNKKILINELQQRLNERGIIYPKWELNQIIDPLFECILDSLEQGNEPNISNFGKFSLKYQKNKEVLHPKTRQRTQIPERAVVVFTPNRIFKVTEEVLSQLRVVNDMP